MQPFEGVRVIDFTHVLAGPFCTYQLAVQGADVVKVESPRRPDLMRSEGASAALNAVDYGAEYLSQGAAKRAVAIDLEADDGRALVRRLIEGADVLVENYTRRVMARFGLDWASVAERMPRLVYCSLTGYGQGGPKADHPAYDFAIQAYSGMMAATGTPASGPTRVGPAVLDYGTGAQAAFAIASALFARERDGVGRHIDVAMLDAALMMMAAQVTNTQVSGVPPVPFGNTHPTRMGYRAYATREGTIAVAAYTVRQHAALWRAVGDQARAAAVEQLDLPALEARVDEDALALAQALLGRTADEWEQHLNACHVPAARVRRLDETLTEAQVASRGVLQDTPLPGEPSSLRVPVAAFGYDSDGPRVQRPPPRFAEHTREVLRELGLLDGDIDALAARGVVALDGT